MIICTNVISIHALLAESDVVDTVKLASSVLFLSTLSLRRATSGAKTISAKVSNFYPRSPCGERHAADISTRREPNISIHALLAESDTHPIGVFVGVIKISIHALLAESDTLKLADTMLYTEFLSTLSLRRATESQPPCARPTTDFYPRSPCGERLWGLMGGLSYD